MFHVSIKTVDNVWITAPREKIIVQSSPKECSVIVDKVKYIIDPDQAESLERMFEMQREELEDLICYFRNSFKDDSTTRMKVTNS